MRKVKILFIFLGLVVALGAGIYFLCPLNTIDIEGNDYYSKEMIEQALFNSSLDKNTVYAYCHYRLKKKDIPFIKDYTIELTGINAVKVTVYEKKIVAGIEYMGEYVYFDRDGTVLESTTQKKENIPYFKNIAFKNFSLYQTIELTNTGIWKKIINLSRLLSNYKIQIYKIVFTDKEEVKINSGKIKIILGNKDSYDDEFAALESVLQKAVENDLSGTIDMRNYVSGAQIILENNT